MTIASDLGFVVGKEYEVVSVSGDTMIASGVKVGDYALFIEDDGSPYPKFKFEDVEFHAYIDNGYAYIEIIPKEKPKMKKEFTKADLKEGMVCILRNGQKYVVYDYDCMVRVVDGYGVVYGLMYVTHSLKNEEELDNGFDIMKVYALGELVWEREEKTEKELQMEKLEATIKQAQDELKQLKEMK